jgi:hypothetical protein
MRYLSTPPTLVAAAVAALAGIALVAPLHDAEARKAGNVAVRDHRAPAPVRVPSAKNIAGAGKVRPSTGAPGTVKKLTCVGQFCPRVPYVPEATSTGTNKARDEWRCIPGTNHCRPRHPWR